MTPILGIDTAWTNRQPSGVALVQEHLDRWRVLCVAPSYESFIGAGHGIPVNWSSPAKGGGDPTIPELLAAARNLGAESVDLIALDIPLAHSKIESRRASDSAISKVFGGRGCSTHSPNRERPGRISDALMSQLNSAGYVLETVGRNSQASLRAIEVYPHPALLTLLKRDYRVPYKVSNSSKYWKGESVPDRIERILEEFTNIYDALSDVFGDLTFDLPSKAEVPNLSHLKRYEDALDALVCAWVGHEHFDGSTRPFGDDDSTIWVPLT